MCIFPHLYTSAICMYLPDLYFCFAAALPCASGYYRTGTPTAGTQARTDSLSDGYRLRLPGTMYHRHGVTASAGTQKKCKSNTKTNICGYSEQQNNFVYGTFNKTTRKAARLLCYLPPVRTNSKGQSTGKELRKISVLRHK